MLIDTLIVLCAARYYPGQVLSVRHPTMGTVELGFTIVVPPGRLGQFTKVVQFWPRLLVVNRLEQPIVLEQNSTLR